MVITSARSGRRFGKQDLFVYFGQCGRVGTGLLLMVIGEVLSIQ